MVKVKFFFNLELKKFYIENNPAKAHCLHQ